MSSPTTKKKPATIADIATLANVAPMTVSRVINGSSPVSERLRKRVEAAISELDFSPNRLARGLKQQRTRVVGILLPDIANPFSAELARGIQAVLTERGYAAFLSSSEQSRDSEAETLGAFIDHRVDGVVVATQESQASNDALARFTERGRPAVVIGRNFQHPQVDRVTADYWNSGCRATNYLIEMGHKRIGFLGVSLLNGAALPRFQGYLAALRDAGIEADPDLIVGPSSAAAIYTTFHDGYDGLSRLMSLSSPPTALFARNDYTAIGAMCAARDSGIGIPDDLSIVGYDNIPLAAYTWPALTTVDQHMLEQGRQAATLLLDRIEQEGGPGRETRFECDLIIRNSTAPPRTR